MRLAIRVLIAEGSLLSYLEISLCNSYIIEVQLQRLINSHKFKIIDSERLVRIMNTNVEYIKISRGCGELFSYNFFDNCYNTAYIDSSELTKIKFSREQKKIIDSVLAKSFIFKQKPSKDRSEMEYRKRAYYGKCKKR